MEDKIIFLGTAGDSYTIGKQLRSSGGILLQIKDIQMHFNPGPGSLVRMPQYGANARATSVIIATSANLGDCNDLNVMVDAMTHSGLDRKGVLIVNDTIVNGNSKFNPYLSNNQRNYVEKVIILKKGQKAGIEDIEIQALEAINEDENAIGLKITTPKYTISFSGNTSYRPDIALGYNDSEILILNVQTNEKAEKGQLDVDGAIKIIKKVCPKLAIINNFGLKMLKSDPLYEAREIQKETGIQTVAAKDGMIISPISYSSDIRQKTLNSFSNQQLPKKNGVSIEVKEVDTAEEAEVPREQDNEEFKESLDQFDITNQDELIDKDSEELEMEYIEEEKGEDE